jgi:uncharacterized protein YukE
MPSETATEAHQADGVETLDATLARLRCDIATLEQEVAGLTAIAQTPSTPNLKEEIETLKTSLTHILSSKQEMRASAQETREEWQRAEKAFRDENLALREELEQASKELVLVQRELNVKGFVPIMRRLLQRKGTIVESVKPEKMPLNTCEKIQKESE